MLVLQELTVLLVLTWLPKHIIAVDEECGAKIEYDSSGLVPWHVGIYTAANSKARPQLSCSGTLISLELVVTAAHCFWVPGSEKVLDASQVTVAVGKIRRELQHPRDKPKQQMSQVEILYTAENYTGGGAGSSPGNLALLKLRTPLKRSRWVWPVCLDKGQESTGVQPTAVGEVSGWNVVEWGWPAKMLHQIAMPVIQLDVCREHLRQMDSENMLTPDKICAGHVDNGTSLCSEDSGSGLVYNEGVGAGGAPRWVLRGVLGAPVKVQGKDSCRFLVLVTMLSFHRNWIHRLFPEFFPQIKIQATNNVTGVSNKNRIDNDIGEEAKLNVTKEEGKTSSMSNTDEQQPISGSCLVPFPSERATYKVLMDRNNTMKPGSWVPEETSLLIYCRKGYRALNKYCVCQNGKWCEEQICEKDCTIEDTLTVTIICHHRGEPIKCNNTVPSGAIIQVTCKPFHRHPTDDYPRKIKCIDGDFDSDIPDCITDCGKELQHANKNIVSGELADPDAFPWHVAFYQDKGNEDPRSFICGGSIISTNWIVSAAHCFYNNSIKELNAPQLFYVAAGKRYREWDHQREKNVQTSKISGIYIPNKYGGSHQSYQSDLALVQVETPFSFSIHVHAVCLDLSDEKNKEQTTAGVIGKVAGFGLTSEDGTLADELQTITLPIIDYGMCKQELERHHFESYFNVDKICVGYLNGSALCNGDSGGGLVVSDTNRWYLRGIVSISPQSKVFSACNSHTYGLLTEVFIYKDFLRDTRLKKPRTDKGESQMRVLGCLLPEFPEKGIYVLRDYTKLAQPGSNVVIGTALTYFCKEGQLSTDPTIYCQEDYTWSDSPQCVASKCSQTQDEENAITESPDTDLQCELPEARDYVNYEVRGSKNFEYSKKNPPNETYGNMVEEFDIILWTCDAGSDPKLYTITSCYDGQWDNEIKCLKRCQMLRYQTVEFTCYSVKNSIINCSDTVSSNTLMIPFCKKGFFHPNISSYDVECEDGFINNELPPECIPTKTAETTTAKYHGNTTTEGKDEMDEEEEGCLIPKFPDYGVYDGISEDVKSNKTLERKKTPYKTVLFYYCSYGYQISHRFSVCTSKGTWSNSPICIGQCNIPDSDLVDFTCHNSNDNKTECPDIIKNGTKVQPVCKNGYFSWNKLPTLTCINGFFDIDTPRCSPECGSYKDEGNVTIETRHTPSPWHAAIYRKFLNTKLDKYVSVKYVCNGNLVSKYTIITVKNCVIHPVTNKTYHSSNFQVGVGKIYTKWEHQNESEEFQQFEVESIKLHKSDDIVIITLYTWVTFSESVYPICLDYLTGKVNSTQAENNKISKVAVWTQHKSQEGNSEELTELSLTVQNSEQCGTKNSDIKRNKNDGCAKSDHNTTICKSNIGSGLAVLRTSPDGFQKRWFLQNVITDFDISGSSECGQLSLAYFFTVKDNWFDGDVLT